MKRSQPREPARRRQQPHSPGKWCLSLDESWLWSILNKNKNESTTYQSNGYRILCRPGFGILFILLQRFLSMTDGSRGHCRQYRAPHVLRDVWTKELQFKQHLFSGAKKEMRRKYYVFRKLVLWLWRIVKTNPPLVFASLLLSNAFNWFYPKVGVRWRTVWRVLNITPLGKFRQMDLFERPVILVCITDRKTTPNW